MDLDLKNLPVMSPDAFRHVTLFTDEEIRLLAVVLAAKVSDNPTVASALDTLQVCVGLAEHETVAAFREVLEEAVDRIVRQENRSTTAKHLYEQMLVETRMEGSSYQKYLLESFVQAVEPMVAKNVRPPLQVTPMALWRLAYRLRHRS